MSEGKKRLNDWLERGGGGEWYEPYVTNRDLLIISIITIIVSLIIILGCWITKYY